MSVGTSSRKADANETYSGDACLVEHTDFSPNTGAKKTDSKLFDSHCRFIGSWVHGFIGSSVHGFMGSWVHGFIGSWVHGFMGS